MSNRQKVDTKAMSGTSTDDSGDFRQGEFTALGTTQKCQILSPYGLCTNPPDESLALAFNIQGIAANKIVIVDDPKNRKRDLAKGEVALYNYATRSLIYLKEDGGIDIEIEQGSTVQILPDGTIDLDNASGSVVTLSPSGVITTNAVTTNITSSSAINLTAPAINIKGDVNVTGVLAATDLATDTISSLSDHTHTPGSYNISGTPVTGVSGVGS